MAEILQSWLRVRLGVLMDLTPEVFGHYTRDGRIMAQILHSYDIISHSHLETILTTQDPALCRVNLKKLRVWLRFLNIDCDDECIDDISRGKGTASLRLFYKLYLCLESKDSLHFITLQKARENYLPTSTKFHVTTVSEDPPPHEPKDHPSSKKICDGQETVGWHKAKLNKILGASRQECKKAEKMSEIQSKKSRKINATSFKDQYSKSSSLGNVKARAYVTALKERKKTLDTAEELKSRMQRSMLAEVLERSIQMQEHQLDEQIARSVLDQSRYEKQIMVKLCEVRNQKNIIAENRRLVEDLILVAQEQEHRINYERETVTAAADTAKVDMEFERMCELHLRLREEKLRKREDKHRRICCEVLSGIIDIAITAAEYRRVNNNIIPETVWCQWKELFFMGKSALDTLEIDVSESDEEFSKKMITDTEEAVIRKRAFEDYHKINSPWKQFLPKLKEDEKEALDRGRIVLGYIVHRLLGILYPQPEDFTESPISKPEIVAVIVGLPNGSSYEPMEQLLSEYRIRIVRVEDAINHCLAAYKNELPNDKFVDRNISAATKTAMTKLQSEGLAVNWVENDGTLESEMTDSEDGDPVLTDTAYIGKWAFEFLTLDQPISNELIIQILAEYLKSLADSEGWVLIDYPKTYEEMSLMESVLARSKVPPAANYSSVESELKDVNIEEIESISPRIVFKESNFDSLTLNGQSKLVPNPLRKNEVFDHNSIFPTIYIKVTARPRKAKELDANQMYEFIDKATATPVDEFYAESNIAYKFYYSTFDHSTLAILGKLVTGELPDGRPSTEIFSEDSKNLKSNLRQSVGDSKLPIVRRLISDRKSIDEYEELSSNTRSMGSKESEIKMSPSRWSDSVKPGDNDWQWIDLPLPSDFAKTLATLWRHLENAYIKSVEEALLLKRTHTASIVPYREFVTRNMRKLIEKPDQRQNLLQEFQRSFNSLEVDVREDPEVKCELHRRVADFQAQLWDMCDEKKQRAEEERRRIIRNQWTVIEAISLFNIYAALIQAELDRCIDTVRILQDYYMSLLNKPLQELGVAKKVISQIEIQQYEESSEKIFKDARGTEEKSVNNAKSISSQKPDRKRFEEEITNALIDTENRAVTVEQTVACKAIMENINYAKGTTEAIASIINESMKKEGGTITKINAKNGIDNRRDLILEWRYAAMYEIDRIRAQLEILTGAAKADITFLLDTMLNTFHGIYDYSIERYKREIESINNMASVFCFAIEEAKPIEDELFLQGDRFVIKSKPPILKPKSSADRMKELASSVSVFEMIQVYRLLQVLRRVAPQGILSERSFVYILQDIVTHGEESGVILSPSSWYELRPQDIGSLVRHVFGEIDYVDWREFILYTMNLPMPTQREIILARDHFRKQDPTLKEIVNRDQFHRTPLWFLSHVDYAPRLFEIFRDKYEKNFEDLVEEELEPFYAPDDRETSEKHSEKNRESSREEKVLSNWENIAALILAKEILCQMFATGADDVNYTAMLLAFCKDDDAREGFGKAFALVVGRRICTSFEEGELHVQKLLEQKRLFAEMEDSVCESANFLEALETANEILERILYKLGKHIGTSQRRKLRENSVEMKQRLMIETVDESIGIDTADQLTEGQSSQGSSAKIVSRSSTYGCEEGDESSFAPSSESELTISSDIDETVTYWIPYGVCLKVLAIVLPEYTCFAPVFDSSESFRQAITLIANQLHCADLVHSPDTILAHRFLNHETIVKFLHCTSKFTVRRMGEIIEKILDKKITN